MARERRRFTAAFKHRVVQEALQGNATIRAIARKHQLHPSHVSAWKRLAMKTIEASAGMNSQPYWDRRFVEDWETFQGPHQSRAFSRLAIEHMPPWLIPAIRRQKLTLVDWGCAQGDGTDEWASHIGPKQVVGVDFSPVAIDQAVERYPAIRFIAEDWLSADSADDATFESFDLLFSSNTLEHFHDPYQVLGKISGRGEKGLVLVVPYRERDRIDEHFFTFVPENIPLFIPDRFRLVWCKVIDCVDLDHVYWPGEQIVLVFADPDWYDDLALSLKDCCILDSDLPAQVSALEHDLTGRDERIGALEHDLTGRDERIGALEHDLTGRDERIGALEHDLTGRDERISALEHDLTGRDERISALEHDLTGRDERISALEHDLTGRDERISALEHDLTGRDERISTLEHDLTGRDEQIMRLYASTSWRLTRPLRRTKQFLVRWRFAIWRAAQRMLHLRRQFFAHARVYGMRSACRRAWVVVACGSRPPLLRAPANEAASPPATPSQHADVPDLRPPRREKRCPKAAMLVQDFHDGGLEQVATDITLRFVAQGIECPIMVAGSAGRAARAAEEAGCEVRVFDGDTARLVSEIEAEGVEVLLVHHCYERLKEISDLGVKLVEVLHNAYWWQRDLYHMRDLRDECIGRFIAVSDFVRDYAVSALSISKDRIHVIENGLSRHGLIRPPLDRLCERRKATIDRPCLLHLANAHAQKNHIAILRAFEGLLEDHADAKLILAGVVDDTSDIGRRVHAEIEQRGLGDHVQCPGPLGRREVSRRLADAHVGLLPSGLEGFSIASLEYTHYGLPTVLSDTGAARRLADRYGHVVISDATAFRPGRLEALHIDRQGVDPDPSTVAGITAALRTILTDYDRFADRARRAGEDWKSYSIESTAVRYHDLLQELVEPEAGASWRLPGPLSGIRHTLSRLRRAVISPIATQWNRGASRLAGLYTSVSRCLSLLLLRIAQRRRGMSYLARQFFVHARVYGVRSACRRVAEVVASEWRRFLFRLGRKNAAALPSATLSPAANVLDRQPPRQGKRYPGAAMLVQDFDDGGLNKVAMDIARQLVEQGIECPIMVAGSAGHAARAAEEAGCDVRVFDGDTARLVSEIETGGVKVLFVHYCHEPLRRLSHCGVKLVEVLHAPYSFQRDLDSLPAIRSECIGRFIAVSDFVRDYAVSALSISKDRIHVIENGLCRHGLIRPSLDKLCERRKTTIDRPRLLHLANAHLEKNHIAILRAFEAILGDHADASLVLAGPVDDTSEVGRRVRAEIEQRGLGDHVRCPGPLGRREVSRRLADAHIGLLPSGFEGCSLALLEYAYYGLPTVLSDTGAARRLVGRYGHAVIADAAALPPERLKPLHVHRQGVDPDPSTVAGITTAMRTVLTDYDRFADAARRAGEDWKSYSIESVATRYRDLMLELVEMKAAA